jgi:ATP-dependent NAD(P)H-hydrate dehydratase
MVTRTASRLAFAKNGRSVVTEDMIPEVGKAFKEVFEARYHGGNL